MVESSTKDLLEEEIEVEKINISLNVLGFIDA